jgi:hypothetical protein
MAMKSETARKCKSNGDEIRVTKSYKEDGDKIRDGEENSGVMAMRATATRATVMKSE